MIRVLIIHNMELNEICLNWLNMWLYLFASFTSRIAWLNTLNYTEHHTKKPKEPNVLFIVSAQAIQTLFNL